jgi:pantothenate synthetase
MSLDTTRKDLIADINQVKLSIEEASDFLWSSKSDGLCRSDRNALLTQLTEKNALSHKLRRALRKLDALASDKS